MTTNRASLTRTRSLFLAFPSISNQFRTLLAHFSQEVRDKYCHGEIPPLLPPPHGMKKLTGNMLIVFMRAMILITYSRLDFNSFETAPFGTNFIVEKKVDVKQVAQD